MSFANRLSALPRLGIGLSTEYGAVRNGAVDPLELARAGEIDFLEVGVDVAVGLDRNTTKWCAEGLPTTYHFLDLNVGDDDALIEDWYVAAKTIASQLRPAWVCGDAGTWFLHGRDRCHGVLMPPLYTAEYAHFAAAGVQRARRALGREVLPENAPGQVAVGSLHPLEYYAKVVERADSGMLLDCAHLAMVQPALGCDPLDYLDRFPLERIVELHVAGSATLPDGSLRDDHGTQLLPGTACIFEYLLARTPNLRAVVVEAEHLEPAAAKALIGWVRSRWDVQC